VFTSKKNIKFERFFRTLAFFVGEILRMFLLASKIANG